MYRILSGREISIITEEHGVPGRQKPVSGVLTQHKAGFDHWAPVGWALRRLKEKLSKRPQVT